jgi:hypothetical protein
MNFPKFVGTKGACGILGVHVSNLRRLRGFPQHVMEIDNKPIWLESDILEFKEKTKRDPNKKIKKQLVQIISNRDVELSPEQVQRMLDIIKGGAEG